MVRGREEVKGRKVDGKKGGWCVMKGRAVLMGRKGVEEESMVRGRKGSDWLRERRY